MDYEGVVLDLDGTVYRGEAVVPGAAAAIERLQTAGVPFVCFSNNPTDSPEAYVERLAEMGIEVRPDQILPSGTVTTKFLASEHPDDAIFLVGSDRLEAQFDEAGLTVVEDATTADVLVASWDREFGYGDMYAGYLALEAGATFYGTDPDLLVPSEDGMVPGSGAIVNAVGGVLDREPERFFGKPSRAAQRAILERLDVPAERCLLVGDRLDTDVALGERGGMTTVLVLSGTTTRADLGADVASLPDAPADLEPDYVIDRFGAIGSVVDGHA